MRTEPTTVGVYTLPGEWCDVEATIVKNNDTYYPLTECCGATATGSEGATCCRSCYIEVDTIFGISWTEQEWVAGSERYIKS